MTDRQEIRVKAFELTIDFFNMLRPTKISPRSSETADVKDDPDKSTEGDWLLDGIFKTCEKFETFILKAPDQGHDGSAG
ncbi:MAG: hypothetical protein LBF74_06180 [Treponema sp.]|nr:hypothetical protein [Treponema sp.]